MINPYTFYCLGFLVALFVYSLRWSEVYPDLTASLMVFLLSTLVAHFVAAGWWAKTRTIRFYHTSPALNPVYVTLFIYCLWTADFIYSGGIPLYEILFHKTFDFRTFGVPSLHVFTVTFSSFYLLYLFHSFLSSRNKLILALYIINSAAAILIYSRSMFLFNLAGSFFLFLFSLKSIPYRRAIAFVPCLILIAYCFGIAGNRRSAFENSTAYNRYAFLETGRATEGFRDSWVPSEFFWSYIYISSPLANLQANINSFHVPAISTKRTLEYINNEFLFESISKRINVLAGVEREQEVVIKHPFNVSTVYSRSYSYLGWRGMIIMGVFIIVLPAIYYRLLSRDNPYLLTGMAILCTMYLFMIYDNTIRLMALGFQLVYPVVFPLADRVFKRSEE